MNDQEYLLNLLRNNLLNSEENTDLYDYVRSKWEKLKSDNIRAREIAERQYSEPNTAFISDDETFEQIDLKSRSKFEIRKISKSHLRKFQKPPKFFQKPSTYFPKAT